MCVRKVSNKGESFGVKGFSRTYKNELWVGTCHLWRLCIVLWRSEHPALSCALPPAPSSQGIALRGIWVGVEGVLHLYIQRNRGMAYCIYKAVITLARMRRRFASLGPSAVSNGVAAEEEAIAEFRPRILILNFSPCALLPLHFDSIPDSWKGSKRNYIKYSLKCRNIWLIVNFDFDIIAKYIR